ncbi:hypothetical protein HDK90DRAFT_292857 [Phyllosticta capitalensis]|uniref:Secreted protein n=1 Tax=Phyllosticta capitalensis TaxID=121624 RepID=A0ABR1YKH6_9PEZI
MFPAYVLFSLFCNDSFALPLTVSHWRISSGMPHRPLSILQCSSSFFHRHEIPEEPHGMHSSGLLPLQSNCSITIFNPKLLARFPSHCWCARN